MDNKTSDEHRRQIIGARRRNNIYGEASDIVVMTFLSLGGDGAIYNPVESDDLPITLYARSTARLYAIRVLRWGLADTIEPTIDPVTAGRLAAIATYMGSIPLIAVVKEHAGRVKFRRLDGNRMRYM
jgi:hypothetical protein